MKKQSIEVAAYPHIDFSVRGKGSVKKDLADVYLKYQKMVRNREKELTAEILILTADAEGVHRLYFSELSSSLGETLLPIKRERGSF